MGRPLIKSDVFEAREEGKVKDYNTREHTTSLHFIKSLRCCKLAGEIAGEMINENPESKMV